MATIEYWKAKDVGNLKLRSRLRSTVETAFFANNVEKVTSLEEAYEMAYKSPGTVITDQVVYEGKKMGLPKDARVLLFNDGAVTGRTATARRILGEPGVDSNYYVSLAREAIFHSRHKKMYHAQAYVGLDEEFMVKAHLLIAEGYENTLYSWLLNFQALNKEYDDLYKKSNPIEEGDIFIYSDPDYEVKDHPDGLALFDPEYNTLMLLGMRYFGEHKKGTLTLGWSVGSRNGFLPCHGGMKQAAFEDGRKYTVGVFGLSGSGKSTLTHDKSLTDAKVTILHDDAYVIDVKKGSTVAMEPTYFDKTQDYPFDHPSNKYLLTVQNCGVTYDEDGKVILVTEDIRNGNGRAIKSSYWTDNRVNTFKEPVDAIIWLMKDSAFPPVMKINDPVLAATMGATLATKRTSAENVAKDFDMDQLVIEPYANPFRTYPLSKDYENFKELFEGSRVDCYIINTGSFLDKKIPKEVTLEILNQILRREATFQPMGPFDHVEYLPIEGFQVTFDKKYEKKWKDVVAFRVDFLKNLEKAKEGRDTLPQEALASLEKLLKDLK